MITERHTLYTIPLLVGTIADIDNAKLVKDAMDNQHDRLSHDNTRSDYEDNHMPMSETLRIVFDTISQEVSQETGLILHRENYWAHIAWHNQSSTLHTHPPHNISAVYYPQVPKDSDSKIVFQWETGHSGHDRFWILPNNSQYIVFPSHLQHYVTRNESDNPRICISVNFT